MPSRRATSDVQAVLVVLAIAILLDACGDHSMTEAQVPLCDGTSATRLLAQVLVSENQLLPGYQLADENGAGYLLVDGTCHYWVYAGGPWSSVREGVLSEAAADLLSKSLDYSEFSNLQPAMERLWDAGTNVTGPVRYLLISEPGGHSAEPHLEWPEEVADAASIALTYEDAFTLRPFDPRTRIVEGARADALRDLRRTRSEGLLYRTFAWIPVHDAAGAGYSLFVRDTIPQEGPDGRL